MPTDLKQYKREWYLKNRELTIARTAARRRLNPELRKEEYLRRKERNQEGTTLEDYRRRQREQAVGRRKAEPEMALYRSARASARRRGIEFLISPADVVIPSICPVLAIPIIPGSGKLNDNSPSIDRIDGSKGYVPGNIWVISWRANRIKSDSTLEELKLLVSAIEHHAAAISYDDI